MSDEQPTIVQLLAKVMADVGAVGKNDRNDHFNFDFRGIDAVLNAAAPALRAHGVVVMPEVRSHTFEPIGKGGRATLMVAYHFFGPRGDSIVTLVPGEALDGQDKAYSKAMSVAFRTALIQTLAIPTNERDPHAGEPVTRGLAQARQRVKDVGEKKGLTFEELRDDYALWSKGAEIQAATEKDLADYLKHLDPGSHTTVRRAARNGEQS